MKYRQIESLDELTAGYYWFRSGLIEEHPIKVPGPHALEMHTHDTGEWVKIPTAEEWQKLSGGCHSGYKYKQIKSFDELTNNINRSSPGKYYWFRCGLIKEHPVKVPSPQALELHATFNDGEWVKIPVPEEWQRLTGFASRMQGQTV
jgi:hypothetical protein